MASTTWADDLFATLTGDAPPGPWDKRDVRAKGFLGQIFRNSLPGLTGIQRSRFLEYAGPRFAEILRPRLNGAKSQRDLMELARDLQISEKFQSQLRRYKTKYEQQIGAPLSSVERGTNEIDNQRPDTGAHSLRPRFRLPGPTTLREDRKQSISDIVQGDLWSFNPPDAELGQNNSLFLDNLQNQALLYSDPLGMPRRPDYLEELVAIGSVPPQWSCEMSDLDDVIHDKIRDAAVQAGLRTLPPVSITLQDNTQKPCPFGLPRPNNYFIPNNDLSEGFKRDFTQGVENGELDRLGWKRDYDTWRNPREPSKFLPPTPIATQQEQMTKFMKNGFDPTFSTAEFGPRLARDTTTLKGSQWMKTISFC